MSNVLVLHFRLHDMEGSKGTEESTPASRDELKHSTDIKTTPDSDIGNLIRILGYFLYYFALIKYVI